MLACHASNLERAQIHGRMLSQTTTRVPDICMIDMLTCAELGQLGELSSKTDDDHLLALPMNALTQPSSPYFITAWLPFDDTESI